MAFTTEELEEMRKADEIIEATFRMTQDEYVASQNRDGNSLDDNVDHKTAWRRAYNRAYYAKNRDRLLLRSKERRDNYRDSYLENQKEYYQKNKEQRLAYQSSYYVQNRERILEKQKLYRMKKCANGKARGE